MVVVVVVVVVCVGGGGSGLDKDLDQCVFHPLLFNLMSILLHI